MKKLMSMVETVPEHPHAKFLQQTPTLGMFVPCDEDGNVLEEPDSIGVGNEFYYERALDQFEQAEKRVIFKGWEVYNKYPNAFVITNRLQGDIYFYNDISVRFKQKEIKTIEDLVPHNLIMK